MEVKQLQVKMDAYLLEIEKATDRACVIVAAAYLDDILSMLLKDFLAEGSKSGDKDLFEGNGPLSTFSSKIKMTHRLGLISNFEYSLLEKVRTIRNRFAHDVIINTFEHEKVKGIIREMIPPRRLLNPRYIPVLKTDKGDEIIPINKFEMKNTFNCKHVGIVQDEQLPNIPIIDINSCRDIFVKAISCLVNNLLSRSFNSIRDKRKIPEDFYSVLEVTKARVGNEEIDCSTILSKIKENKLRIDDVKEKIIEIEKNKKIAEERQNEDSILKCNNMLSDLSNFKDEFEKIEIELEKTFLLANIQKFVEQQIEKALKKEGLI